jgi:hypothetical protein
MTRRNDNDSEWNRRDTESGESQVSESRPGAPGVAVRYEFSAMVRPRDIPEVLRSHSYLIL